MSSINNSKFTTLTSEKTGIKNIEEFIIKNNIKDPCDNKKRKYNDYYHTWIVYKKRKYDNK